MRDINVEDWLKMVNAIITLGNQLEKHTHALERNTDAINRSMNFS